MDRATAVETVLRWAWRTAYMYGCADGYDACRLGLPGIEEDEVDLGDEVYEALEELDGEGEEAGVVEALGVLGWLDRQGR